MELQVRNTHGQIPTSLRDHASKRLAKLERFLHRVATVDVSYEEVRGRYVVDLQVDAGSFHVRGTGEASEARRAVDRAVDHVEDRLKRFRGKLRKHRNGVKEALFEEPEMADEAHDATVKERRKFSMKPTTVEEAALQMELLGRDYFIFNDHDTGAVCLLYRLSNGHYGLAEPE